MTPMRVAGNQEGEGGKGDGNGKKVGVQVDGDGTKRTMATKTRKVGKEESNGKGMAIAKKRAMARRRVDGFHCLIFDSYLNPVQSDFSVRMQKNHLTQFSLSHRRTLAVS